MLIKCSELLFCVPGPPWDQQSQANSTNTGPFPPTPRSSKNGLGTLDMLMNSVRSTVHSVHNRAWEHFHTALQEFYWRVARGVAGRGPQVLRKSRFPFFALPRGAKRTGAWSKRVCLATPQQPPWDLPKELPQSWMLEGFQRHCRLLAHRNNDRMTLRRFPCVRSEEALVLSLWWAPE